MSTERIGRAVLELVTDSKAFNADVDQVERRSVTLSDNFKKTRASLDQMVLGMSRAGKEATASSKLIAGMSESGRLEMSRLASATSQPAQSFRDLAKEVLGTNKEVGLLQGVIGKFGPALAASFTVGAAVGFVKSLGESSGHVRDLSSEVKIGVERLQAFQYVGAGVGLTLDDLSTSAFQLAKRIGAGEESTAGALKRLNLSIYELQQLKPDEQLFRIGRAFQEVTNQNERATIANDLFGKSGARMLRLFEDDLEGLVTAAEKSGAVIQEELINSADDFDDAWSQAILKVKAGLASLVLSPKAAAISTLSLQPGMPGGAFGFFGAQAALSNANAAADAQIREAIRNPASVVGPKPANPFLSFGTGASPIASALQLPDAAAMRAKAEADVKAAKAAEKAAVQLEKFHDELARFNAEVFRQGAVERLPGFLQAARHDTTDQLPLPTAIGPLSFFGELPEVLRKENVFGPQAAKFNPFGQLPKILQDENTFGLLAPPAAVAFSTAFGVTLKKSFGPAVLGALQGGGDVLKSIGGAVGQSLTESLFGGKDGLTSGLGGVLSGGLTKALGKTVGGALSAVLPGIGALAGPAIEGLGKLVGKLFGGEGKQVNDLRDKFFAAAGGTAALAEKARQAGTDITELLRVSKVKDFEAAVGRLQEKLGAFASEQEADAQRLTAAIQKYGFSFEQLGPVFQKQQLDDQAKELIEDWRVLVASGIELTTVNDKMAEAINDYVRQARAVGAELPAAFRPIIQKMIEQGLLTDEAGVAITDLEEAGIQFSETMTQGFDRVIVKLDELIAKLVAAGTAMSNIGVVPSGPSGPSGPPDKGSDVSTTDVTLGTGGIVTRPTFALVGEDGPEAVLPLSRDRLSQWFGQGGTTAALEGRLDAVVAGLDALRRDQRRVPTLIAAAVMGR